MVGKGARRGYCRRCFVRAAYLSGRVLITEKEQLLLKFPTQGNRWL